MPFVFIITHIVARLCLNVKWGERNAECRVKSAECRVQSAELRIIFAKRKFPFY